MVEGAALPVELRMLAYLALLCLVLWLPYILAAMSVRGLMRMVSYPTGSYSDLPDWAQRSQRAHMNLVENLVPFAALVLVAQIMGISNEITALGAQIFLWGRLAHVVVHIIGVPWLRTGAFPVAWIGCLMIFWQVITG